MSILKILGERIRIVRLTAKISQKELAIKAGTNLTTISQIERGVTNVSINNLSAIAQALNCQLKIDLELKTDLAEASKKKKLAT